jgi:hypothetical protein
VITYNPTATAIEIWALGDAADPEMKWRFFVEIDTVQAAPYDDSYRAITKGGATLNSSLTSAQVQTSVTKGAAYKARYFRIDATAGTTLTINQMGAGAGGGLTLGDGYCYLTKGATRGGSVLASDDDAGPGADPLIVYTIGAGDGTEFVIECTSYGGGATGTFALQVT